MTHASARITATQYPAIPRRIPTVVDVPLVLIFWARQIRRLSARNARRRTSEPHRSQNISVRLSHSQIEAAPIISIPRDIVKRGRAGRVDMKRLRASVLETTSINTTNPVPMETADPIGSSVSAEEDQNRRTQTTCPSRSWSQTNICRESDCAQEGRPRAVSMVARTSKAIGIFPSLCRQLTRVPAF